MGLPEGAVEHGSTVTPIKDAAALAELATLREQIGESGGFPPTPGEFQRTNLSARGDSADESPLTAVAPRAHAPWSWRAPPTCSSWRPVVANA